MACLFCDIVQRKRPAKIVYEDQLVMAFEDINPQAPVYVLIVPKAHISTNLDLDEGDSSLVGHMFRVANRIARDKGVAERGFRLVMNCNPESGQTGFHIHLHVLGGRFMQWPPG